MHRNKQIHQEGDIGVCGIAILANFSCGISVILILNIRYCGILQTCGMRFLDVLVDDIRYKNVYFTFFRSFLAVSGRFGSNLKRPCVLTTSLSLVTVSTVLPLVIASIFALGSTNPPAIQVYYEIAVFSEFFCGIAIFVEFFCGNAMFSNPQCPAPPN